MAQQLRVLATLAEVWVCFLAPMLEGSPWPITPVSGYPTRSSGLAQRHLPSEPPGWYLVFNFLDALTVW